MTSAYSATAMQSLIGKIRPTPGLVVGTVALTLLALLTGGGSPGALADAALIVCVLVGSVLAHEMSHAVVARRVGMTVDTIRVSLLGGVTHYSGADPGLAALRRIALAGPKTSFLVAFACLAVLGAEAATGKPTALGTAAAWGLQANLVIGTVNLLPFGSLDGAALRRARRRRP